MDEFFAAIETGDAAVVRAYLKRDASSANAVKIRTSSPDPKEKETIAQCGSGLPKEPVKRAKPLSPHTITVLQLAVKHNHLDIVRLLLESGAEVNATNGNQLTALHYAMTPYSDSLNLDLIRLLVESGADVNARDKANNTPLNSAFSWRWDALPAVELLLAHGADVNGRTEQRRTPLDRAVIYLASPSVDHARLIETLLRFGANPNPVRLDEEDPSPPLCTVVRSGNVEIARMLIEAGADVNASDRWGSPLHFAAEKGFDQIVELLLKAGADPSVRNPEGRTPIDLVEPLEEMTNHFEGLLEQR